MTEHDPAGAVNALADRFWEALLATTPTMATMYGDERYDDRLDDPGPVGRAERRSLAESTIHELDGLPLDALPVEEAITADLVRVVCDLAIAQEGARYDLVAAVDQIGGPQTVLPQVVGFQKVDTPARVERLLARIRAYRGFIDAHIGLLGDQRAAGVTAPRAVAQRTIAQLERLLAIPPATSPVVVAAKLADEADRERLAAAVRDVVYPALADYLAALRGDYLAATRVEPGLWSAARGEELYRLAVRSWTTLDLDPLEVHRIGLDELGAIDAERRVIARAAGFGDDTKAYRVALAADPANVPASKAELVARAAEDIERALAAAPRWFGRLPRAACEVRPVEDYLEKDAPFAYYYPPATDGSRPGRYNVNGYDLSTRTYTQLASTTFHESVPGHHFQIAIETELEGLPAFRRLGARVVGGAYVEGWGLYAERLADEMGLFRSEAERFGMLDGQAWRAARLVVDTGLHALRKDRAWAVATLRDAGLSETDANIETDRYIVWPGQALTYKIGQREIERLRAELAARDGSAFDIRAFHDAVLGHASLPLATLARELPAWHAPAAA